MTPVEFQVWLKDPAHRPLVMGVLNVTPDSFSDGGQFNQVESAVAHAVEMIGQGADLIDIGGESTKPGSEPVSDDEQIRRVVPAIQKLTQQISIAISVDTTRSAVARAALDAGASILNDISAGRDDAGMFDLAASRHVPIVLMHMQGTPKTMQHSPTYADVVAEVKSFLNERAEVAIQAGVAREQILIDPGIGFGKTTAHNLAILKHLSAFTQLPYPLLMGVSRKRFLGEITGESLESQRRFSTAAAVAWSVANGSAIVRVHDVEPMNRVVKLIQAIRSA